MRYEDACPAYLDTEGFVVRKSEIKRVIRILVATNLYKALPARERYDFLKYLLGKFTFSS